MRQIKKNKFNIFISEKPVDSITDERVLSFWDCYQNNFEDYTFNIFDRFLDKDHGFMDIGAWVGATVLYGAHIAKTCYCFEPDKLAFEYLKNNIEENINVKDKIKAFDFGVSDKNSRETFYVGPGSTSMSSLKPIWKKDESYDTSVYNYSDKSQGGSYDIDVYDFPTTLKKANIDLKSINFIKIDIEGGEFDLIPSMIDYFEKVNYYPTLYISLHTPFTFSMFWKKSFFHKLVAYLPKKISARIKNKKLITKLSSAYTNIYLRDGKHLKSVSELGDARAFVEIVVTNSSW
ncbi:FkbM family methyltransferase [Candidatus Gracilibacteria bacterium]|nr:FkbM family methyltransferase [Candidatus Gracilibacteria bacterium]